MNIQCPNCQACYRVKGSPENYVSTKSFNPEEFNNRVSALLNQS